MTGQGKLMRGWVAVLALLAGAGLVAVAECTVTVQPGESIHAAIDAAPEGAVICLSPGEWEEKLVIEKPLSLRGAGAEVTLVRGGDCDTPVIRVRGPEDRKIEVSLTELAVTGGAGSDGEGIRIEKGAETTIRACAVTANGAGIVVMDIAKAEIVSCRVYGNTGHGIWLLGNARASIVDCTVSDNPRHPGVAVVQSAWVTVQDSQIHRNGQYGIVLGSDAEGLLIEDSTIRDNGQVGVFIFAGAQATVRGNEIHDHRRQGVEVRDAGTEALIEGNNIRDNLGGGIYVYREARGTVRNNQLRGNGRHGITVFDPGTEALIEGNTIGNNVEVGILITDGAQATVRDNEVRDNERGIMVIKTDTEASIEDNLIQDNSLDGLGISGAQIKAHGNRIYDNGQDGIRLLGEGTKAELRENAIHGNGLHGIKLEVGAQAEIEGSVIEGNTWGIWTERDTRASIVDCRVSENTMDGIVLGGTATVSMERNEVIDNGRYGVSLFERPCAILPTRFAGAATGRGNIGGGNAEGDCCPDDLSFLFTEEGGELDRRE